MVALDRPILVTVLAAAGAAGLVVAALWVFGWLRAPGPASIDDALPFIDQAALQAAAGNDDAEVVETTIEAAAGDGVSTVVGVAEGEVAPALGGAATPSPEPVAIVVHVAGAVLRPGLVTLDEGARVQDAIDAAGGSESTADLDRLNLATVLVDGQRLYVPVVGESDAEQPAVLAPSGGGAGDPSSGGDGATSGAPALIDVNTATASELETVPGIGPVTAERIITKREAIGGFKSIDDLLDVSGIGETRLASMRDYLRVG